MDIMLWHKDLTHNAFLFVVVVFYYYYFVGFL